MPHEHRTPITALEPIKFAPAPALVPPLEAIPEGYNLLKCHICGATEDPSQYDDALGYRLIEHDECFGCFFDESDDTAVLQPVLKQRAA